ncbi:MAG: [protein-PII] uridylyltransferase [candidate division NC10 bacterium]|nr:[protein-PII] uridylyltransferase [candidate division NC10 bacterium]
MIGLEKRQRSRVGTPVSPGQTQAAQGSASPAPGETYRELEGALRSVDEEAEGLSEEARQKGYLETFRSFYRRESERIFQLHRQGAGGRQVIEARAALVDAIIGQLYLLARTPPEVEAGQGEVRCALLALGGYGRRELSPCSDIDIMFLFRKKLHPCINSLVERVLYTLWDMGLAVGHSCRSITDCVQMARRDLTVKTSLLEARYIAGDQRIFQEFETKLEKEVIGDKVSQFFREKMAELEARYEKFGRSLYLQEPNIKESMGGLRDLQHAQWMARARYGINSLEELVRQGVIEEEDLAKARGALDFLWRLRNELHYLCGQKNDVLSLALQRQVADHMGYGDDEGGYGVEHLMRQYFLHAKFIHHLSEKIIYRCLLHTSGVREIMQRFRAREMGDGLVEMRGKLGIRAKDREDFAKDPLNLFRVFLRALRSGFSLTREMQDLVRSLAGSLDDGFRSSPQAFQLFLSLLKEGPGLASALRAMHESGLLGAYLPEFGRLTCLVQYDFYHKYTVDEHTFVAFHHLEELLRTPPSQPNEFYTIARELERPDLFKLALLLHDVGKAEGKDHVSKGARIVTSLLSRFPLSEEEKELVIFLVSHHLTMAHIAERRDLDDERAIIEFAKTIRDVPRLKMLYLHTFLDLKAVNPEAWTEWKSTLLWELYIKTHTLLTRGIPEQREDVLRAEKIRAQILKDWGEEMGEEFIAGHLDRMPTRYLLTTPEAKIASHLRLVQGLTSSPLSIHLQHFPQIGYSEFTVCTLSHPGLFADIVGVLSAHRINVLSAQIYTRADGVVIDTFQVNNLQGMAVSNDSLWHRVEGELQGVLTGRVQVEDLIVARGKGVRERLGRKVLALPPRVEFDNYISDRYTVIDVRAADRLGLLYLICQTLSFLGLDIAYAKITTEVDQAMDVFYVTERDGGKVEKEERLTWVKKTLEEVLSRQTGGA